MSPFNPRGIYELLTPAERRQAFALLALTVVGMGFEMLGVGLAVPAVVVIVQTDLAHAYPATRPWLDRLGNPTQVQLVVWAMVALVLAYAAKGAFLAYLFWRQTRFAFGVQAQLSQRLFTSYLRQPYTFHLERNSAQLIQNIVNEVSQFTFSAMLPTLVLLTEGLVLAGIIGLLLAVQPVATPVIFVVLLLSAWSFDRVIRSRLNRAAVERQHHDGLRMQHLQQGLGGVKEVKLLGRESEFLSRYADHNSRTAQLVQLQNTLQQLPRLWLELLGAVALAAVVLMTLARERPVLEVVPVLGLFSAAAFRLMPSMTRVMGAIQYLRSAAPVIATLRAEMIRPQPETPPVSDAVGPLRHELRLVDVSFAYPGAPNQALVQLSVRVARGEAVGFIGPSGAGKSTLVDVMLGLLTPQEGAVLVDGRNIQANLRSWQSQIGYVPQAIYLTDETLRRNIAFGVPEDQIDDVAVARALRAAQLDQFVQSLPAGWNTQVGERGVRLSGGQRQRIGIARALYHDPGVLVLDEATSALDAATERGVMDAVATLHGTKTLIIIAHRLSTVQECDRLYRLESGRVVSEGTPRELIGTSLRAVSDV